MSATWSIVIGYWFTVLAGSNFFGFWSWVKTTGDNMYFFIFAAFMVALVVNLPVMFIASFFGPLEEQKPFLFMEDGILFSLVGSTHLATVGDKRNNYLYDWSDSFFLSENEKTIFKLNHRTLNKDIINEGKAYHINDNIDMELLLKLAYNEYKTTDAYDAIIEVLNENPNYQKPHYKVTADIV